MDTVMDPAMLPTPVRENTGSEITPLRSYVYLIPTMKLFSGEGGRDG